MAMTTMTTTMTAEPAGSITEAGRAESRVRFVDQLERMLWTFVAAFTSALVTPPLAQAAGVDLSLSGLEAGLLAGASAVLNFVTVTARWRLSVLPDPGAALRREPA